MASAFSHALVALALGRVLERQAMMWRVLSMGAVCSIVPDLDVIGLYFGIQYGDLWGHRGLTHSICFAVLLSAALIGLGYRQYAAGTRAVIFLYYFYYFLCIASHGVLDAMTDGGVGRGVLRPV